MQIICKTFINWIKSERKLLVAAISPVLVCYLAYRSLQLFCVDVDHAMFNATGDSFERYESYFNGDAELQKWAEDRSLFSPSNSNLSYFVTSLISWRPNQYKRIRFVNQGEYVDVEVLDDNVFYWYQIRYDADSQKSYAEMMHIGHWDDIK